MSVTNPVTFIDLCRRTGVECGVAPNVAVDTALPTVTGATGSWGRIVNWTAGAWTDLQCMHDDWMWMRSTQIFGQGVSFSTVAGQFRYPLGTGAGTVGVTAANFGKWDPDTFWSYTTANGFNDEIPLAEIPSFDVWRSVYMSNANRNVRSRPVVFTIGPDQSVNLGPNVSDAYTVTADYFVAPSTMEIDADVPVGLPSRFIMTIVYLAMIDYGKYEAAPEVVDRGETEYTRSLSQLSMARAPRISWGSGALA